jgi:methionine-rich copper-binding protein CopC
MIRPRLLLPAIALAVITPAIVSAARVPHLKLRAIFQGKDTTVTTQPEAVKLWLSELAELTATKVAVTNAAGAAVPTAKLTRGTTTDEPVMAKFTAPLTDGKYTITWKAMSKDGHVVNGVSGFTVKLAK